MTTEKTLRESYHRRINAALASSTGAAAIGVGVAAMMPAMPLVIAVLFLLIGIGIHIAGMVLAHRADAEAMFVPPGRRQALTIVCWLALVGFAALATVPFIS